MRVAGILYTPGVSASYFDDLEAVFRGARKDGFLYRGEPVTEGFTSIRQPGQSLSVSLILENGDVASGDCVAVQYSGAAGRDPLFQAEPFIQVLRLVLDPLLIGTEIGSFRETAEKVDRLVADGKRLHTALRYGVSQAVLDAVARNRGQSMLEVLAEEYGLSLVAKGVPLLAQSGEDRYGSVDRMVLKGVDVLPHGLINSVEDRLGKRGEKLKEYLRWLVLRIRELRPAGGYRPVLHLDVYGTVGRIFDNDAAKIADYLASLEGDAGGFEIYIEGPVDMGGKSGQIAGLGEIRRRLEEAGSPVKIVADEWCNSLEDIRQFADSGCCHMIQIKMPDLGGVHNSLEAVLYVKERGLEAYLGGSANETDVSARVSVHVAMASRPERMMSKPGLGFDEGFTVTKNEMSRLIELIRYRQQVERMGESSRGSQ